MRQWLESMEWFPKEASARHSRASRASRTQASLCDADADKVEQKAVEVGSAVAGIISPWVRPSLLEGAESQVQLRAWRAHAESQVRSRA